ncbi:ribonuclease M5 [Mangrovibacillus cuniculi]|uniref:Ribonuclease M5 n=1 Tax=Mangrovibacillus cuniculi TaxID=2593652 RepID=A0A7S8CDM1_9BACI|nr:ribonuclease M5 [Mangrovibacillus cuniculi]QPC47967.1 ribonuclease M5 [Mangrovibacillus cuniculi]
MFKEVIVVEGRDDTTAIKRAVDADTIETNGSAVSKSCLEQIKLAQQTRGVIVFTDPDYPGQKIRQTITEYVPGCKHAFLPKSEAIPKKGKGLGVEHASIEAIRTALQEAKAEYTDATYQSKIPREWIVEAGLLGGDYAKSRREKLGDLLQIGYANGKQLEKRLAKFQIEPEKFIQAMQQIIQEEQDAK